MDPKKNMQLGIRPKSDFMYTASWGELYVLTEHWQSDLEFYGDEIKFLQNLMSKYFLQLVQEENAEHLQDLVGRLLGIDKSHVSLKDKTIQHLSHLVEVVKDSNSSQGQQFRDEHADLEDGFTIFVNDFKTLKKDVFKVTEHILHTEKFRHLLGE